MTEEGEYVMKRSLQKWIGCILAVLLICGTLTGCKSFDYKKAQKLCENGKYLEASKIFASLEDYEDSTEQAKEAYRLYGVQLSEEGNFTESISVLEELSDYVPAEETLSEVKISYGKDLFEKQDYEKAVEVFQSCEENDMLKSTLDVVANGLIAQGDYKDAGKFLYLHDTSEEWMQDFLYKYLNWQMDNQDYADTAETFSAVQGYQDTLTNDKFAGAHLMSMGTIQWDDTEIDIWSGGSVLMLTLSFTEEQQLHFSVSGGTVSFYTFQMTNEVNLSDSWDFYFEGRDIYVNDDGQFIKAGTIGSFHPASGDEKETVSLSLDLPGMMNIKSCDFGKE